jgi:hypothetical protein
MPLKKPESPSESRESASESFGTSEAAAAEKLGLQLKFEFKGQVPVIADCEYKVGLGGWARVSNEIEKGKPNPLRWKPKTKAMLWFLIEYVRRGQESVFELTDPDTESPAATFARALDTPGYFRDLTFFPELKDCFTWKARSVPYLLRLDGKRLLPKHVSFIWNGKLLSMGDLEAFSHRILRQYDSDGHIGKKEGRQSLPPSDAPFPFITVADWISLWQAPFWLIRLRNEVPCFNELPSIVNEAVSARLQREGTLFIVDAPSSGKTTFAVQLANTSAAHLSRWRSIQSRTMFRRCSIL